MADLVGKVNESPFIVGARKHAKPAIIPAGYCLYHGCSIDPVLIEANQFSWVHRFSVGSMILPEGIPAVKYNGSSWPKPDLPIRYGYWIAYKAKTKKGFWFSADSAGNLVDSNGDPIPEGDDYVERVPKALVVFPAYAWGGDFNAQLGII